MTPKEAVNEIKLIVDTIDENLLRVMDGALNNLYGEFMERIFNDKKDANESSLGQYSTKPTLIGAKSFRNKGDADRFFKEIKAFNEEIGGNEEINSTQGFRTLKKGKSKGKKAYLLPGGYKRLREIQGLQVGEIDLQYRKYLLKSIVPSVENGKFTIEIISEKEFKKARGFEERKGKSVFFASEKESENAFKYIEDNLFKDGN